MNLSAAGTCRMPCADVSATARQGFSWRLDEPGQCLRPPFAEQMSDQREVILALADLPSVVEDGRPRASGVDLVRRRVRVVERATEVGPSRLGSGALRQWDPIRSRSHPHDSSVGRGATHRSRSPGRLWQRRPRAHTGGMSVNPVAGLGFNPRQGQILTAHDCGVVARRAAVVVRRNLSSQLPIATTSRCRRL